jgi:N-acetylglucosamine malate deacetylase 1
MADVLVFGAHPDDAEFGMGASMAKFVRCGASVAVCVLTRGEAGTYGTPVQREAEMRSAAARLGAVIDVLDFKDCQVFDSYAARTALAAVIRRHRPRIIFAPYHTNPASHLDGAAHPDHMAAGTIARSAARYARFAGLKDIPGEPWNAAHLLYYMVPRALRPTHLNDVSAYMDDWETIARCHVSQMSLRDGKVLENLRKYRLNYGIMAGVDYAEAFIMEEPALFDTASFLAPAKGSVQGVQEKPGCSDLGE